jgi:hypothetical protein
MCFWNPFNKRGFKVYLSWILLIIKKNTKIKTQKNYLILII